MILLFLSFLLCGIEEVISQEKREYEVVSIAFYNLENLFDTQDDPKIFDDDRTPNGKDRWTEELYRKKIENMAFAIHEIGQDKVNGPPALLGVAEVENRQVLEDLIETPLLAPYNYGIIHVDSPDERGIDVALLYQKTFFIPLQWANHELILYDPKIPSKRDFTRDQLVVTGLDLRLQGAVVALLEQRRVVVGRVTVDRDRPLGHLDRLDERHQ